MNFENPVTLPARIVGAAQAVFVGRGDVAVDEIVVDHLMEIIAKDGYRMQTLITEIVTSYPFVNRRIQALIDSIGLQLSPNANYDAYYGLIDFEFWARKNIGNEAVEYLKKHVHPLDLAFRLAEAYGIVLLNGGGFEAPNWSLRVSLANLPDEAYEEIGRGVRLIARGYRDAYEASNLVPAK